MKPLMLGTPSTNEEKKSLDFPTHKSPAIQKWNSEISHVETDQFPFPHPELPMLIESLGNSHSLDGWTIPRLEDKALARDIYRLKVTILWWEKLPGEKFTDGYRVMFRCLSEGPAFAEWLDDAIKYSLRLSTGVAFATDYSAFPEQADSVWGLDYFFSPYHLIPFKPVDKRDYELVFQDPPEIEAELLENLKEVFRDRVKQVDKLPQLDDLDRLKLQTGTKVLDPISKKRRFNFELRGPKGTPLTTTNAFKYERLVVFKAPHESRDCFVPDEETRNSLLLIHKQCGLILDSPYDDIPESDFTGLQEWLSGGSNIYYIMADQKKCGLTFPLPLIKALIEVLHELYPNENLSHFDGYLNASVTTDGKNYRKIRNGTGLGMANEVTSFITACVFETWMQMYPRYDVLSGRFYNDDQVIRYRHTDGMIIPVFELEYLVQSWNQWMAKHGMTIHEKKPFVSISGVYLETYGTTFHRFDTNKRTQYVGCLFHALTSTNIVAAKDYVASVWSSIDETYISEALDALEEIIRFWGYEFYQNEVELPLELGGWIHHLTEGFNLFLRIGEDLDGFKERAIHLLEDRPRVRVDSRSVKITNPERFQNILDLGWEDDPTVWAWTPMAGSALGPNKVRPSAMTLARQYKSRYELRQRLWKQGPYFGTYRKAKEFYVKYGRGMKWIPPRACLSDGGSAVIYKGIPKPINHWYQDKARMWYEILRRAELTSVSTWNPWEEVSTDDLLACVFQPPDIDIDEVKELPVEALLLGPLWGFSSKEIDTWMRIVGPYHLIVGAGLTEKDYEALHRVIPGEGNTITWDPIYGEPVFVSDRYLGSVFSHNRDVKELVVEWILDSWHPGPDYYRIGADALQEAIAYRDEQRYKSLEASNDHSKEIEPEESVLYRQQFRENLLSLAKHLCNRQGLLADYTEDRVVNNMTDQFDSYVSAFDDMDDDEPLFNMFD